MRSLATVRAGTADPPETWAAAVAAGAGLPAAAGLGPASYYADFATPHGRRHVRVRTATACFAAQGGRHLTDAERELGVTAGTASPDGGTALQAVRCSGFCYAGPAVLDGEMPRRGANLRLDPVDVLDLHPDDAVRYGLRDVEPVTVESRHGSARLVTRVGEHMAPGQVFCSFHFPTSGVNSLTSDHADTVTSCPAYKVTAVRSGPRTPRQQPGATPGGANERGGLVVKRRRRG